MRRTLLFLFFLFVALTAYGASTNYDILTGQFLNHNHIPLYADGVNVGIGSSSPRAKLDVDGAAYVDGDLTLTGSISNNSTSGIGFITDKAVYIGGNVGIGTTSAAQALHVEGSVYFGAGNVGINTVSPLAQLSVKNNNTTPLMVSKTGSGDLLIITSAGNVGIGTATPRQLLDVDGAVYMKGNVGIGSVSPGAKLDINNLFRVDSTGAITRLANTGASLNATTWYMYNYGGTGTIMNNSNGSNTNLTLSGSSATNGYLTLRGTTDGSPSGDYVRIITNGAESVRITGANVGIGSTAPRQMLDVEGAVYTSGNVGIGTANPLSKLSVVNPGIVMIPPADQTITAGATITANACGGLKKIISGSSVTTSTTNTFTAPSTTNTGCCMDVCNTGTLYNITLDANALFVSQGGADVVMTPKDCVRVCSYGTGWIQISPLEAN